MGSVYRLTLHQVTSRWRLAIMTLLAAMPVLVATLMLRSSSAPSVVEFETAILSAMLAGSIAPLVVLAAAAVAFANEVEDRTLANLTLTPLPRWQIVVPKLLATLTVTAPFIAASAFTTTYIAFLGDGRATVAVTAAALAGVAMYAAAFLWLGLVTTQAIGAGLLYIILWEGFFAGFVSGARILSIRHTAIALMHWIDPRRFADHDHLTFPVTSIAVVAVVAGFTWLAVRQLRRMDVP